MVRARTTPGEGSGTRLLGNGVDPSHLSRVLRQTGYKTPSGELTRKVAEALGLPEDYFLEYRQAVVLERIQKDSSLRERLYRELK